MRRLRRRFLVSAFCPHPLPPLPPGEGVFVLCFAPRVERLRRLNPGLYSSAPLGQGRRRRLRFFVSSRVFGFRRRIKAALVLCLCTGGSRHRCLFLSHCRRPQGFMIWDSRMTIEKGMARRRRGVIRNAAASRDDARAISSSAGAPWL